MSKMKDTLHKNWINHRELILLLSLGGFYSLGMFISNTFINIFLWEQANNFKTIAFYNLSLYIFQFITFIFSGYLAKKIDRIFILRIGMLFFALFFLAILYFEHDAVQHIFLLGALLGIGYGFYWMSFRVLTFEITEPETRNLFNGFFGGIESIAGMIGPVTAGYFISRLAGFKGYTIIFSVSFGLFLCAIVISFFITKRSATGKFNIREIIQERKRNQNWNILLYAHLLQGMREGIFLFVITIWIFIVTDNAFLLGLLNLIISFMSFVSYFIVMKKLNNKNRNAFILFGASIVYICLFLIIFPDIFNKQLYVYAIIYGLAFPIFNIPYTSLTYDIIGSAKNAGEYRVEYIVVRESFITIGRITSVVIFLVGISLFVPKYIIPGMLILFGLGYLLIYITFRRLSFE